MEGRQNWKCSERETSLGRIKTRRCVCAWLVIGRSTYWLLWDEFGHSEEEKWLRGHNPGQEGMTHV